MPRLHDAATRTSILARIAKLSPGSARLWGKMSPDQMLWHCAEAIDVALGHKPYEPMKGPPLPAALMRMLILHMPWPKGKLDTAPQFVARQTYDFESEKARLVRLLDELAAKPPSAPSAPHPLLGNADMEFQTRLHAKHLHHHLTQFGV